MLISTNGIVLNKIKYGESSLIVKIYTEQIGLVSFMAKGAALWKKNTMSRYFQPLYPVKIVFDFNQNRELHYIKEICQDYPLCSITEDVRKGAIAIFVTELLLNMIKESEMNQDLFKFIRDSVVKLENKTIGFGSFHLIFAIKLTKFFGFYPLNTFSEIKNIFDMPEGKFVSKIPAHNNVIRQPLSLLLSKLLDLDDNVNNDPVILPEFRDELLEKMMQFYSLHNDTFKPMKSYSILHTILN